jgi:hypothetical protein
MALGNIFPLYRIEILRFRGHKYAGKKARRSPRHLEMLASSPTGFMMKAEKSSFYGC